MSVRHDNLSWIGLPNCDWASSTTFKAPLSAALQTIFDADPFLRIKRAGESDTDYTMGFRCTSYTIGADGLATITVDGPSDPLGTGDDELDVMFLEPGTPSPVSSIGTQAEISGEIAASDYAAGWRLEIGDRTEFGQFICIDDGSTKGWCSVAAYNVNWERIFRSSTGSQNGTMSLPTAIYDDAATASIYAETFTVRKYIGAGNDGSNYWSFTVTESGVTLLSWDDSAEAANDWTNQQKAVNTFVTINLADSNVPVSLNRTKVLSAPDQTMGAQMAYRLVAA